jgi:hypothetical protein
MKPHETQCTADALFTETSQSLFLCSKAQKAIFQTIMLQNH